MKSVRIRIEKLESRLLLTTTPSTSLPVPDGPVTTPSLVLLTSGLVEELSAGSPLSFVAPTALPPATPPPIPSASPLISGRPLPSTPIIAVVQPVVSGTGSTINGMIAVISTSTGNLGQGSVSPIIVVSATGSAGVGPVGAGGAPTGGAWANPTGPGEPAAMGPISDPAGVSHVAAAPGSAGEWSGQGQGPFSSTSNSSSSPMMSAEMASVPDSRYVAVEGSLDSNHNSFTLRIPVGPTTRELGLSVHGNPTDGSMPSPVLGLMTLVDRNGRTLATLGPFTNDGSQVPSDAVTLSLKDVPYGGTLLVQIDTPSAVVSGPMAAAPSNPSPGVAWSVPFVMDVQRIDTGSNAASVGLGSVVGSLTIPGRELVGTLASSGAIQDQGSNWGTGSASQTSASDLNVAAARPSEDVVSGEELTSVSEETATDFSGRLATGPLAARTSAPLGPNLSNVSTEPAPAIDRHERALSQELGGDDAGDGPGSSAVVRESGGAEGGWEAGGAWASGGESVLAAARMGPLQLRDSAGGATARGGELGALQAAMTDEGGSGDGLAAVLVEDRLEDPVLIAMVTPRSSDGDRRPTPDYLTTACILALGMGLVTGPIIPDLLRLLPARSSRWRPIGASAERPLVGSSTPVRWFGLWRRRRIGD